MTNCELIAAIFENIPLDGSQRTGQWCFNRLSELDIGLANAIRGTDADPFYDDNNIERFFDRIVELNEGK